MKRIDWAKSLAVMLVFLAVAPMIGFLVVWGWGFHQISDDQPRMQTLMLIAAFYTFALGYIVGAPMALLTGLIAAAASHGLKSGAAWVVLTTVVGAAVAWLTQPLFGPGMGRELVTAGGTLAALACALVTVAVRPKARPQTSI